jgi:hypothetical protein
MPALLSAFESTQELSRAVFKEGHNEILPTHARTKGMDFRKHRIGSSASFAMASVFDDVFLQIEHLDSTTRMIALRRTIIRFLLSKNDGEGFMLQLHAFRTALELSDDSESALPSLHMHSSIAERMRVLDGKLTDPFLIYGLLLAARAGITHGLRHYIHLCTLAGLILGMESLDQILWHLLKRTQRFPGHKWDRRRYKQEMLTVLTGWTNGGVPMSNEIRQPCIWTIAGFDYHLVHAKYYDLLCYLAGPDAIYSSWLQLTACRRWQASIQSTKDKDREWRSKSVPFIIKHLTIRRKHELAWKVLLLSDISYEEISNSAWSKLLDHPEFITKWSPGMAEPVLSKCLEYLEAIETEYGVEWTGGEHGSHVTDSTQPGILGTLQEILGQERKHQKLSVSMTFGCTDPL